MCKWTSIGKAILGLLPCKQDHLVLSCSRLVSIVADEIQYIRNDTLCGLSVATPTSPDRRSGTTSNNRKYLKNTATILLEHSRASVRRNADVRAVDPARFT